MLRREKACIDRKVNQARNQLETAPQKPSLPDMDRDNFGLGSRNPPPDRIRPHFLSFGHEEPDFPSLERKGPLLLFSFDDDEGGRAESQISIVDPPPSGLTFFFFF